MIEAENINDRVGLGESVPTQYNKKQLEFTIFPEASYPQSKRFEILAFMESQTAKSIG